MPEGHTIHRAARDQQANLAERELHVLSPQGRFTAGAALVNGRVCTRVEALGKHLLYHFDNGLAVHIHLGLAGVIRRGPSNGAAPRDVVRVRFETDAYTVDISGPAICALLEPGDIAALRARIGPDVLAPRPDPERAFTRIRRSKAPIGALLMNQQVISGIGNIYRVEVLWILGIDPRRSGHDLTDKEVREIWKETRKLMQDGVRRDAIRTRRVGGRLARYGSSVNIYNEESCPTCLGPVTADKMGGRSVYYCPRCQT
ncbi:MAG: DNA-formamidopyrimidine glycosylase family protein [Pseudomonadota bacterium]